LGLDIAIPTDREFFKNPSDGMAESILARKTVNNVALKGRTKPNRHGLFSYSTTQIGGPYALI
jgi:hypothetical protein